MTTTACAASIFTRRAPISAMFDNALPEWA